LVIDAFAGLIPGWECSLSKQAVFVESAIRQAAEYRARQGNPISGSAIHHSDAGSQYTSVHFTETLMLAGLAPSIGTVGDALDNAVIESWHSTVEFELRRLEHFATKAAARAKVAAWIEDYNTTRRHSSLGMRSPVAYERALAAGEEAA